VQWGFGRQPSVPIVLTLPEGAEAGSTKPEKSSWVNA
jgi:hypothetical protein